MFMFGIMLPDSMVTTAGQVPQMRKRRMAMVPTTPMTQRRSRASETAQWSLVRNCSIAERGAWGEGAVSAMVYTGIVLDPLHINHAALACVRSAGGPRRQGTRCRRARGI